MTLKPRVHVIVLGGTITMMPKPEGGIVPSLGGDDLIAAVPALPGVAELSVETPFLVPGASLSFTQLRQVSQRVEAAIAGGAHGVVVVQGTDTIDETAFLLDLAHASSAPVVVTGAMRGADAPGADGPGNLLASISVAASTEAEGLGVLVVLNDEIHSARFVEKSHKALPSAFTNPSAGPVGAFIEGEVRVFMRPERIAAQSPMPDLARVATIKLALGDDGDLITAALERGYAGLVIEAMGAGHVPAATLPELVEAVAKIPVVLTSRVPAGPVFERTYGFPGSERDLLAKGLIPAGLLSPHKARLLLAYRLGQGDDRAAIAEAFRHYR